MKYYKTVIFDFDGTIADSFSATYKAYNILAKKYKLTPIPQQDIHILKTMKPFELLSYCKVPFYLIPVLLMEGRSLIKQSITDIKPFDQMVKVIRSLSKSHTLGILTSNSKENVEIFLKQHNLEVFDFIHAEKNLFGKDKALQHLIETYALDRGKTIYVGDEVRDIISCNKIDLPIISVTWGFNERGVLEKQSPNYLVNTPEELQKLL